MYSVFSSVILALFVLAALALGYFGFGRFTLAEDIMDQMILDTMPRQASALPSIISALSEAQASIEALNRTNAGQSNRLVRTHWAILRPDATPLPGASDRLPETMQAWFANATWDDSIKTVFGPMDGSYVSRMETGTNKPDKRWVGRQPDRSLPPIYAQYVSPRRFEARTMIRSSSGAEIGILQVRAEMISILPVVIGLALALWLLLSLAALVLGLLFGGWAAQSLKRRLGAISTASDGWALAKFDARIKDTARDEIGQLARRLNRMADEWQLLLETRRALTVTEERNRFARDLHDSVKQQMFAASLQLGAVNAALAPEAATPRALLKETRDTLQLAYDELTTLIGALRPAALNDRGLASALHDLAEGQTRRGGTPVTFTVSGERALPLAVEHALFRVAQEALANITRHSKATQARMALMCETGSVQLMIRDDGTGFDPSRTAGGIGLQSMRERMDEIGGTLQIAGQPGMGSTVTARASLNGVAA